MSKVITKLNDNDTGLKLYTKSSITIEPGISVLVGCNGAGKTTLMNIIKNTLNNEDIPYIHFDNTSKGGRSNLLSKSILNNDMTSAATAYSSSEGELIMMSLGNIARDIGNYVRKHEDIDEYWILLDGIDSGFSIDNILDLKEYLFKTLIDDVHSKNKEVYIIVTGNTYEMCNGEKCIDVNSCKYIEFKSYDEYRKFILKSKDKKDKRYND